MENLGFFINNAWIVPILPLLSFLINGLVFRNIAPKATGVIGFLLVFCAALFSYKIAFDYYQIYTPGNVSTILIPFEFEWMNYLGNVKVGIGTLLDHISILMLVVVTTVSSLVHFYSIGYMSDDPGFGRFFTYLGLFTFNMLGLILAPNLVQTFVFWELVGLSSFLLIGFYYKKDSAVLASKKAFIVTRFADLGFVIGILGLAFLGHQFSEISGDLGALDFKLLNSEDFLNFALAKNGIFGIGALSLCLILVYIGAAGKSAMFPLHIWLPDAMEGPTPVSALIHAATMVVAGVYLTARLFPAFSSAPYALDVVAYTGAFTSLFAAVIACTQDDIKRVLAFSTLSQLGYLMLALGVATLSSSLGYTASMFHLFTHAFFKALLFLGAGSVIHAVHSNSIWDMGGLYKKMPITHITFLIATLAIAGVPPLSGFFSKDEILASAVYANRPVIAFISFAVAGLTAFYMFRIYFVTFWGKHRTSGASKAHESPFTMTLPLIILAILSIFSGLIPFSDLVSVSKLDHHGVDKLIASAATGVGVIGIIVSYILYGREGNTAQSLSNQMGSSYKHIKNKFYIDEVYLFFTKNIIFNKISAPIAWFDKKIIDAFMDFVGIITEGLGNTLSEIQNGKIQFYSILMVLFSLLFFVGFGFLYLF